MRLRPEAIHEDVSGDIGRRCRSLAPLCLGRVVRAAEETRFFRPIEPNAPPPEPLPDWLNEVYEQCLGFYERLFAHRII